jgi:hypothetical protein
MINGNINQPIQPSDLNGFIESQHSESVQAPSRGPGDSSSAKAGASDVIRCMRSAMGFRIRTILARTPARLQGRGSNGRIASTISGIFS